MSEIIPAKRITSKILFIRSKEVILDRDLAELYDVETKVLNQAVKRNIKRFPEDFMFQLTKEEFDNWKSQFVTSISSSSLKMGLRKRPLAFTENGVAMLSSVLNSEKAIQINIQIMRVFTQPRGFLSSHKELRTNFDNFTQEVRTTFLMVLAEIDRLNRMLVSKNQRQIGFKSEEDE